MRVLRGVLLCFALIVSSLPAMATPPVFNGSVKGNIVSAGLPAFDAKFYGAKGDGTTDDTSAIQSALNAACPSAGGQAIGYVYLEAGNYKITSTLNIQCSDEGIKGSGLMIPTLVATPGTTTLTWSGATGGTMILGSAPAGTGALNAYGNLSGMFIDNLKLASGNGVAGTTGAAFGFEVKGVWHSRMSNVACDGFTSYCFYPTYDSQFTVAGSAWSSMDHVYGEDFTGGLVWYDGSYGNTIYDVKFTIQNGTGIRVGGGMNTTYDESDDNTFIGLTMGVASNGTGTAVLLDCNSQNTVIYGMAIEPITVKGTSNCTSKGGASVANAIYGDGSYDNVGVSSAQPNVESGGGLYVQMTSGTSYKFTGGGTAASQGTQYYNPPVGASPPPNLHSFNYVWNVQGSANPAHGQDFASLANVNGTNNWTILSTQPVTCGSLTGNIWNVVEATGSGNALTNTSNCFVVDGSGRATSNGGWSGGVNSAACSTSSTLPCSAHNSCATSASSSCQFTVSVPSAANCATALNSLPVVTGALYGVGIDRTGTSRNVYIKGTGPSTATFIVTVNCI